MLDERLEQAIRQTNASLVVLDPIQSFLGAEVDMHRANEIRPLMKRVSVQVGKYYSAIVLISHMNKNSTGKSSYRELGSIDFQAAAKILDEYMKGFQERNSTLRVFSVHFHMDEATPHLHIDFVPYITGSKRGLDTRVSLK